MKDFAFKGYNVIFIIAKWLKKHGAWFTLSTN